MLLYILKSGLCLLVLFSFYKIFLENEKFHTIKRIYLIGAILLSIVIPFITFSYTIKIPETETVSILSGSLQENISKVDTKSFWQIYLPYFSGFIYISGFIFFGYRFARNLNNMMRDIRNNNKVPESRYVFVLLGKKLDPYSFLNYIFLNSDKFKKHQIESPVIQHEKAHVDQRHSLDTLLLEVIQVLFWFNPLFIWYKKSVRLNHEFLADRQVLSNNVEALEYSNLLYNYSSGYHHNSLSSPINHSLIKKRIIMITKTFSRKRLIAKAGLFIPVLCVCFYLFNNDIVAKPVEKVSKTESNINYLKSTQDIIAIRLEEDKIFVNGNEVELSQFAGHLDKLMVDKTDAEIKNMSFRMQVENADDGLLELLNKEFEKTRFSKLTGYSVLPPPPPAPVEAPPIPPSPKKKGNVPQSSTKGEIPPPPPPLPAAKGEIPAPPPPSSPDSKNQSNNRTEIVQREQRLRDHARERQRMLEKRNKIREERMSLRQEIRLTEIEKERKIRDLAREKERIERRMQRIKSEQERLRSMKTTEPSKQKTDGEKVITEDVRGEIIKE